MSGFEEKLAELDISIFDKIDCQLERADKRSLLALQQALRELRPDYRYLEIGSYLGGSIQPHLLDPKCARIISIDKRPESQPDARGIDYHYLNNSTARMIDKLRGVSEAGLAKLTTIDGDTGEIDPAKIGDKVDFCFIDGEHTDVAAFRDFEFCLKVTADSAIIAFHDAPTTYDGIAAAVEHLEKLEIPFRAYNLPAIVFIIELGGIGLHRSPAILDMLTNNHKGYIYSLQYNDNYRRFATKLPFRIYYRLIAKLKGINKFD